MSKMPLEIRIDPQVNAGYIRYTDADYHESIDIEPTGAVAVDVDAAGDIIGIEIIAIDDAEMLALAENYAADHGLEFPRDLAGASAGITR